ncbi:hypothetical protein SLEP1_g27091 [Rubroshorea leprosula]|uniref:Uncharacterized protein n=1 Tax=Rubroshorea leprosula TaxID=152421 RepID=A0AAV5K019_9ROSI|nr:hypothetical protein SLEP1_g27091 [Rubroshorea leprosula]
MNGYTPERVPDRFEKLIGSFNAYSGSGGWNHKENSKQVQIPAAETNKLDGLDAQSQVGPADSPSTGPNQVAINTHPLEPVLNLNIGIEGQKILETEQGTIAMTEKGKAEGSFRAGMESESGEISEWMKRSERVKPKKSRKRAKSSSSVYRNAKPSGAHISPRKGKGGEVRAVAMGNEEEVIQQIEKMETRDREARDIKAGGEKGANGMSGVIWNVNVIQKISLIEGDSFIDIKGLWGSDKTPIHLLNVYSSCELAKKRTLWMDLKQTIRDADGIWCLIRDFKAVRNDCERVGRGVTTTEMREFDAFIRDAGLLDLPFYGRKYTCRSISDHCLVLLKNQKVDWGPKLFRFFDTWIEKEGFKELVKDAWTKDTMQGWKRFCLKGKLKKTKAALKEWTANHIEEVESKIQNSIQTIAQLDTKNESCGLNR